MIRTNRPEQEKRVAASAEVGTGVGTLCARPSRFEALEQRAVVEFAVVEQDVRVRVGRHLERALADERANLGPGASLPVQQRDTAMAQVVRTEVGHASRGAGASDRSAKTRLADLVAKQRRLGLTVIARRQRRLDRVGKHVRQLNPERPACL